MSYDGCIRIEKAANGWEVEFREPDKTDKKGMYLNGGKEICLVFMEKDKKAMLAKVAELVDELKAPSPSQEYAAAFKEEAASEE